MESLITDEERKENGCIDALRVFDSDQRGYISLNELQVALRSMPGSAQMKEFELRDILQEADPDGDGKVKIQGEWISLMIKENVKRQTAYARDYFLGMASFMCALLQLPYHPGRVLRDTWVDLLVRRVKHNGAPVRNDAKLNHKASNFRYAQFSIIKEENA